MEAPNDIESILAQISALFDEGCRLKDAAIGSPTHNDEYNAAADRFGEAATLTNQLLNHPALSATDRFRPQVLLPYYLSLIHI